MSPFNIHLTGVGGQGIGLLSEVITRAALAAGYQIVGSDTHGLAQRGGIVVSSVRIGATSPLVPHIPKGRADLVVALERLEALRAVREMLRPGGKAFYLDAVYQPIGVRMGESRYPAPSEVADSALRKGAALICVSLPEEADPKLQNIRLLAALIKHRAVDGITVDHAIHALKSVLPEALMQMNLALFEKEVFG